MWHHLRVHELIAALHAGHVEPWALFTHFWQRAEQAPQAIWTHRCYTTAAAQARASQSRWEAGQRLGPLDGIPVAIKDAIDVQGEVTTMGSATRRQAPAAPHDAPLIAQLRAQGMVLMGRTNLSEFAFSGLGINPHFGTPALLNAQGEACAPGGSSSGSAMALVHGLVPLAVGTDTSGSVRVPCAWNGLVGYRPSVRRYPQGGVFPLAPALDVCGPMGRNVHDVMWLDAAMRGPVPSMLPSPTMVAIRPTLWVVEGIWTEDLDPAVQFAWQTAIAQLRAQGWQIAQRRQPAMEAAIALQARMGMLVSAQAAQVHAALLADSATFAQVHEPVRLRLAQAGQLPADRAAALLEQRAALQQQWQHEVGDTTAVIIPTTAGLAPALTPLLHDTNAFAQANMRALRNTLPSSFLCAPSITIPLPSPMGAACGMHISCIEGHDDGLLAWAQMLEAALHKGESPDIS